MADVVVQYTLVLDDGLAKLLIGLLKDVRLKVVLFVVTGDEAELVKLFLAHFPADHDESILLVCSGIVVYKLLPCLERLFTLLYILDVNLV